MLYSKLEMIDVLLEHKNLFVEYNLILDYEEINSINEKLRNKDFVVSVIGCMKSGKSTFLNALLGAELMPNENAACTLTTTEIINDKDNLCLTKQFESGNVEHMTGDDLSKTFLEEIRSSRKEKINEDFKYVLNYDIEGIDIDNLDLGFKLVDTPGVNEMSGLGVDKNKIVKIFDKQLKKTDYIIYILDYKYYKSVDNIKILEDIKKVRQDILDENNIIFILNKIDLITYKDGSIEEVVEEIKKLLETIGIKEAGILPFSAKKAFLYKLMKNNKDLTLYEDEIESMTEVIEKEINGELYNIKIPRNELIEKFYSESNIGTFENIVLKQLYSERERLFKESLIAYEKSIINKFIKDNENTLQRLVDETNTKLATLKNIEDTIEQIKDIKIQIEEVNEKVIKITTLDKKNDAIKKYLYTYETVRSRHSESERGTNFPYDTSEAAIKNGKIIFKNWKNTINLEFIDIYERYHTHLEYKEVYNNKYFRIKKEVEKNLCELKNICIKLEEVTKIPNDKIINFKIKKRTNPIMNLEYNNSKIYFDRIYDNAQLVTYNTKRKLVKGFFSDKYKTTYDYDISKAQAKEEKEAKSAKNSCSKAFFEDYYEKDCKFKKEINSMFFCELAKVTNYFEKIENTFIEQLKVINKESLNKDKEDIIKMVSVYNKFEWAFRGE